VRTQGRRRGSVVLTTAFGVAVLGANAPLGVSFVSARIHAFVINQPGYKRQYGHWETVVFPSRYRVNAIHAALLQSGKVLLMAGSGNDNVVFSRGTFKTLLWDPQRNSMRPVSTPADVFCGGHAFVRDGKLLIAGGTQRYEALSSQVTNAGGGLDILNYSRRTLALPGGTRFTASNGQTYVSDADLTVPPMRRYVGRLAGVRATVTQPGFGRVWVDAVHRGAVAIQARRTRYSVAGQDGQVSGIGDSITLQRQFFQGTDRAFLFDAVNERYDAVPRMKHKRWYPSLATLSNGDVIAVSGLDGTGDVNDGHTEIFSTAQRRWVSGPIRYFPTYPSLFLMPGGKLFFSGGTTGYGPADYGRTPGVWDLRTNAFQAIGGLADAGQTETAASVLLPPAQLQRVMLLGGGGIGSSTKATSRTAVVDLLSRHPRYQTGATLPHPTRYPLAIVLPDDTVFVTGGARYYRGNHRSDNHDAEIYDPATNRFAPAATPDVGRNYHSEALLLPDGRVATFGSNPLWADVADTTRADFEQRVQIYSPPYLFRGPRPIIGAGPASVARGSSATFQTRDASSITRLRLVHPGAYTHVTDLAQRSVAVPFIHTSGGLKLAIPRDPGLVPAGWYMLFALNRAGVPSVAKWVKVV
jgi:hypothetical protein